MVGFNYWKVLRAVESRKYWKIFLAAKIQPIDIYFSIYFLKESIHNLTSYFTEQIDQLK